jgi:hypothetical protein
MVRLAWQAACRREVRTVKRVDVDEEVVARLESLATGFHETPNSVIRRILELDDGQGINAATDQLPEGDFRIPLLTALVELGGEAKPRAAIEHVGRQMADQFGPADHSLNNSGRTRWKTRVRWCRNTLANEGLIDRSRPGIWRITPEGERYLRDGH